MRPRQIRSPLRPRAPAAEPPPRKPQAKPAEPAQTRFTPSPDWDTDTYVAELERYRTIARLEMLEGLILTLARRTGRTRTI